MTEEQLEVKEHTYQDNCVYNGQWKGRRRHGEGTFKWPSNAAYVGSFDQDKRHGKGKLTYSD